MKKTTRWCVVLAVLTVSGCKSPPAPHEAREGTNLYGTKSCVENDRPGYNVERNCFANKADFQRWRACVDRGGTAVECYSGPRVSPSIPIPPVVLPQPSADQHFRFSYVILPEAAVRAAAISDYEHLKRLALRQPVCSFVGDLVNTSALHELKLDHTGGSVFTLTLDVRGDSAGCAAGKVNTVQITFLGIPKGIAKQGRNLFDTNSSQYVLTGTGVRSKFYRPYFSSTSSAGSSAPEVFFAYFDYLNAPDAVVPGSEASGSFAFLARHDGSENMMVVFDGTLRMKHEE